MASSFGSSADMPTQYSPSPGGRRCDQVATLGLDNVAIIWDGASGRAVRSIKNHVDFVSSPALGPDVKRLASGSSERTAKVHDPDTGLQVASLAGHEEGLTRSHTVRMRRSWRRPRSIRRSGLRIWPIHRTQKWDSATPARSTRWHGGRTAFGSLPIRAAVRLSFHIREIMATSSPRSRKTVCRRTGYITAGAPDNRTVAAGGWAGSITL